MKWLYFVLNQIVGQLFTFVIGVASSVLASVLFRLHEKWIVSSFESFQLKLSNWCSAIGLTSKQSLSKLKVNGRVVLHEFVLTSRVILTSSESVRLTVWGLLAILLLPGTVLVLTYFKNYSMPSRQTSSNPGKWTYRISNGESDLDRTVHFERDGVEKYSAGATFVSLVTFEVDGSSKETYLNDTSSRWDLETKDISGDQVPDLLLIAECGCSAGFTDYRLLSLDTEVREIFSVEAQRGRWNLDDLDGDTVPEIATKEFIGYNETPFVAVPAVQVILRYRSGKLNFATDLMKKPAPSEREFRLKVANDKLGPDPSYIAQLVFSGNGELAHRYVNLVLADEPENERGFYWSSIYGEMMASDYWEDVAALNQWIPDQYAFKDCPY